MRYFTLFSVLVIFASGCQRSPVNQAIGEVTAQRLKEYIATLSDDSLQGRGPSTEADRRTTTYLAEEFKRLGLEPAGDHGSYLQRVPIIGSRVKPFQLELKKASRNLKLEFVDDFVAFTQLETPTVSLNDVDVVFVGYGIEAPELDWDDYKGVSVAGKVLLMLNDDPPGEDPKFFGGKARTYYGRWTYKFEIAAKKGAVGALILHTTESAGYPFQVWQSSWSNEQFSLDVLGETKKLKIAGGTTEHATRDFVALAGHDLGKLQETAKTKAFKPVPLGLKLSARMNVTTRNLETQNVLGILRGGDAELSRQYIVFSAHHDHLGISRPVNGDSIYNGALDNASGTSMMLSMAKGFSSLSQKPKRSLLFAAVAAEEQGLLGSEYHATHPTVPLDDMVANINTDGMNIWGKTSDITFLGWDRSTLKEDIDAVAKEMNMTISPDAYPEKGFFYRSDHFNFAKVGIPSLSYETGNVFVDKPADYAKQVKQKYEEQNYHQPSDELSDDWVFDGAINDCEFIIRLTLRLANSSEMPMWNKGDEFEAARLRALER
ncbi:MAG: M28 family peptidase [Ignavibacteriales bacterium]|nr:M28 family peptidase [Ignavibacteriales bacterium]